MIACRRYRRGAIDCEFHCRVWITEQLLRPLYNLSAGIFAKPTPFPRLFVISGIDKNVELENISAAHQRATRNPPTVPRRLFMLQLYRASPTVSFSVFNL